MPKYEEAKDDVKTTYEDTKDSAKSLGEQIADSVKNINPMKWFWKSWMKILFVIYTSKGALN